MATIITSSGGIVSPANIAGISPTYQPIIAGPNDSPTGDFYAQSSDVSGDSPLIISSGSSGPFASLPSQDIKLTVIGGGSTYCPELILRLCESSLNNKINEITLYDVDARRVEAVAGFCKRVLESRQSNIKINWSTDPAEAFKNAKVVFNMMRAGGMEGRYTDEQLPRLYGVIGQETMAIGGFRLFDRQSNALEPLLQYLPKDVIFFNFANPSAMLSQWLSIEAYAPSMVLGLCNIPFGIKMEIARVLKAQRPIELGSLSELEVAKRVEIDSVGLNHYTFFRNFRFNGVDVTMEVIDGIINPPANFNVEESAEDLSAYRKILIQGLFPNWYFRYRMQTRKYERILQKTPIHESRAWNVREQENILLGKYDGKNSNESIEDILAGLMKRGGAHYATMAVLALEAVLNDSNARYIVNTMNLRPDGKPFIPWLPPTYVEVPCFIGKGGATVDTSIDVDLPKKFMRGIQREAEAQNLWIQAHRIGISKDESRSLMQKALMAHPLIGRRFPKEMRDQYVKFFIDTLGFTLPGLPALDY